MRLKIFLFVFVLGLISPKKTISQEEDPNAIMMPLEMISVISGTANASFGVAKGKFTKGGEWKHPFGFSVTGGAGFSFMIKNNIGFEADISYELNQYMFNNSGVNLMLGYRAPYADIKVKKIFNPGAEDSFYFKGGFGYMFGGAGGVGDSVETYAYTINFISRSIFLATGEIGFQKRTSKKNYHDIGVVYRYGLSSIISSDMVLYDLSGSDNHQHASSVTAGSYIGVSYKYYIIFKEIAKKHKQTRVAPDKRF